MTVNVVAPHIHLCGWFVKIYLVTSVFAHRTIFLWFNSSVYLLLTLGYPQSAQAVLPCILDMDLEGMQVRYQT